MKALIGVLVMAVMMAGIGMGNAWAGDSKTFTISCTIPEIPGVNVPAIEERITLPQEEPQAQPQEAARAQEEPQLITAEQADTVLMYTYVSR
jgi:hypothetical protein